jgi:alpha-ketoglutarate-dependent taurine dioxygenase
MSALAGRRKAVSVSDSALTRTLEPDAEASRPPIIEPAIAGVNLTVWAGRHRDAIAARLTRHGAILLRGFELESVDEFQRLIEAVSGEVMEYSYRSTPRERVSGRIYTSTEYPPDQHIPLHSEMAYARTWPGKIFFYCLQVPGEGGETPIADNRRVLDRIDPGVREPFERKGVMYVRNYGQELDLPWQEVFQTTDKHAVESYCAAHEITVEWRPGERLRTRQICQAVVSHPVTGERSWFNQAHLFHVSALPPGVRESLLSVVEPDELPRDACYGDGSPFEEEALDAIRAAYEHAEVVFPWQAGDILVLDNVLVAHGRRPFAGPRRVVVGMAEPRGDAGAAAR